MKSQMGKTSNSAIEYKSWEEFRSTGLLWFINTILHMFGWAICILYDNGHVIDAKPARTRFRGFSQELNDRGYKQVTRFIAEHADELLSEIESDVEENK